jgi:hypothetical protein
VRTSPVTDANRTLFSLSSRDRSSIFFCASNTSWTSPLTASASASFIASSA